MGFSFRKKEITMVEKTMINECFFCGVEESKRMLFDAVVDEGLVKICDRCSREEHVPVIRKPTTFQLKESEREKPSFYERAEQRRKELAEKKIKRMEIEKQDVTLKDIINRTVKLKISEKRKSSVELVDNFHWIIMRARRKRKITQGQLAREIHEAEAAIEMIEKGQLPSDDYRLVNKIENYLGIRIRKQDENYKPIMDKEPARILEFDPDAINNLTISDLQRMKQEREGLEKDKLMREVREKLEQKGEI